MHQANRWRLEPKDRADVEDNFRKTITQLFAWFATLFAGVIAIAAAVIAYLQLSEQQRSAHDLLISNQVSKGFEQLGGDKLPVRLGGIYALEGVMNASEQYHRPVLEGLCAFVRDRTQQPVATDAAAGGMAGEALEDIIMKALSTASQRQQQDDVSPPAADVQAALTVIGRRSERAGDFADLHGAHLNRADLFGAHLDDANLSGAHLNDAELGGAHLNGNADLSSADLSGARLNDADLSDAHLNNALLGGAHLNGASLSYAHLNGATLGGAHLNGAHLDDANLSAAGLGGAHLNGADLSSADLTDVKGLTQEQLNAACGTDVKGLDKLKPPLKLDKPYPEKQ